MRIAWFTPFATASAIGRASQLVTDELSRAADVDIWHPAAAELHATRVRTLEIPQDLELLSATLGSYDLAVYNFGNYLPYHREIFEISRRVPGVAVLHDYVMHHFFAAYWLEYRHAPAEYREAMRRCYGPAGEAAAGENPGVWGGNRVVEFPLFEEATRGAYAAVVHSDYMAGCVGQRFPGPVRKLALAYDLPPAPAPRSRQELGVPRDHALLVSVGHVNPNKRILEVIEALAAEADLSRRVTYAVVGPMDPSYGELLLAAVRRHGLERNVRLLGYTSDADLRAWLENADLCINLRYPSTEGASASAIEELRCGKPLVVTDVGFYSELPEDCVRKIRPGREAEQLAPVLRELIHDEGLRRSMGARGRQFSEATFRADRYAEGILELAAELGPALPYLQLADRMGRHLADMGVGEDMPLVRTTAETASELFLNGKPADR